MRKNYSKWGIGETFKEGTVLAAQKGLKSMGYLEKVGQFGWLKNSVQSYI